MHRLTWVCLLTALTFAQEPSIDEQFDERLPSLFGGRVSLGGWYDLQAIGGDRQDEKVEVPHLSLFAQGKWSDRWSSLLEVAYRKMPEFVADEGEGEAKIERAYLEYRQSMAFKVRAGKVITPAGLWKQMQWSIMVDTTEKPLIEEMEYIPNQSVGVEVLGSHMTTDWEWHYELFVTRDEGNEHMGKRISDRPARGGDLNFTLRERYQFGAFYQDFRNPMDGADPLPGDRKATMIYSDIHLIPHRLNWRGEYLQLERDGAHDIEGYYTRLKYHFRHNLYANYRYDDAEVPKGHDMIQHQIHTATIGFQPLSWLRTRAEWADHRLMSDGVTNYNKWSLWMGILF